MAYMERWAVAEIHVQQGVKEDSETLIEFLDDGWEPIGATTLNSSHTYWHLRKFLWEQVED